MTICSDAKINPKLAGIDNNKDNSKDLFCMLEILFRFFDLKAFDKTGRETVPTAIPAIDKLYQHNIDTKQRLIGKKL